MPDSGRNLWRAPIWWRERQVATVTIGRELRGRGGNNGAQVAQLARLPLRSRAQALRWRSCARLARNSSLAKHPQTQGGQRKVHVSRRTRAEKLSWGLSSKINPKAREEREKDWKKIQAISEKKIGPIWVSRPDDTRLFWWSLCFFTLAAIDWNWLLGAGTWPACECNFRPS